MEIITLSRRSLALCILTGIISILALCTVSVSAMTDEGMTMDGPCAMNHQTSLCPMAVQEHLSFWQEILATPSFKNLILISLLALSVWSVIRRPAIWLDVGHRLLAYFRKLRFEFDSLLFDHLRQQFSQGILHPKSY